MITEKITQKQIDKIVEMTISELKHIAEMFEECEVDTLFAECVQYELKNRTRFENSHTA